METTPKTGQSPGIAAIPEEDLAGPVLKHRCENGEVLEVYAGSQGLWISVGGLELAFIDTYYRNKTNAPFGRDGCYAVHAFATTDVDEYAAHVYAAPGQDRTSVSHETRSGLVIEPYKAPDDAKP